MSLSAISAAWANMAGPPTRSVYEKPSPDAPLSASISAVTTETSVRGFCRPVSTFASEISALSGTRMWRKAIDRMASSVAAPLI